MADLLLGELRELIVEDASGKLVLYAPQDRWLTWDPGTRRLWCVAADGPDEAAGLSAQDVRRVLEFHWSASEAEGWRTWRPRQRRQARAVGALAGIVYLCEKEGTAAEFIHWFNRRPDVATDARGEFYILGPVDVTGRGITS